MNVFYIIRKVLSWILLFPVYIYKWILSPVLPQSCRHIPTCSTYTVQAIKIHGPFKGLWYSIKRISRCHPWGTHGYDPVPPKFIFKKMNFKHADESHIHYFAQPEHESKTKAPCSTRP